jgi:pimeloyl-ACP methyl ester carboxylesterase
MPFANAKGAKLHYEVSGAGTPIVFVHEFGGDYRSWEPQVRHFCRCYQCITFNARGYPPSDVPNEVTLYSQDLAADDIVAVMDHLGLAKAHIVGISMGAYATVHFGLRHANRALSLTAAALGYGSQPQFRDKFRADSAMLAEEIKKLGAEKFAEGYALGPYRLQFKRKDERGWLEFKRMLGEHSTVGTSLTMLGVQKGRPALYELEDKLRRLTVPFLIVAGDEDDWCLEMDLWLKRAVPSSGLLVLPKTGHTINLEEPDLFNHHLQTFLGMVEHDAWPLRDPATVADSALMAWKKKRRRIDL